MTPLYIHINFSVLLRWTDDDDEHEDSLIILYQYWKVGSDSVLNHSLPPGTLPTCRHN